MRVKDIRPNHLDGTIENAQVGDSTKSRMKSMFNLMFRYALKYDIVKKIMLIYVIVQKWEQRIQKFLFHQKK